MSLLDEHVEDSEVEDGANDSKDRMDGPGSCHGMFSLTPQS